MTPEKAIELLEGFQSQIIHGKQTFHEIAELIRSLKPDIDNLVGRFLQWPLPESVCSDLCVSKIGLHRTGTNLLTADEARAMLRYLLGNEDSSLPERVSSPEEEEKKQSFGDTESRPHKTTVQGQI